MRESGHADKAKESGVKIQRGKNGYYRFFEKYGGQRADQ